MKPIITNQEILLFKNSCFSQRDLINKDKNNNKVEINSYKQELERVCSAGMLCRILPDLTNNLTWNILSAHHYLLVIQCSYTHPVENETSIDPHLFLASFRFN